MNFLQEISVLYQRLSSESRHMACAGYAFAETEISESHSEGLYNTGEGECFFQEC